MIQESNHQTQNRRLPDRRFDDLTYYVPAEKLVDQIFKVNGIESEPFLKMMAWLKAHISDGPQNAMARDAILNLTVAAYRHAEQYYEQAERYAASLWGEPRESNPDTGRSEVSAPKDSYLSDSIRKSDLIDEWALNNRDIPSVKLDLIAALVGIEDDLIIEALLVALKGKEGVNE